MKIGRATPWGKLHDTEQVACGILAVTCSRGRGLKLDRMRNADMPRGARLAGGWYADGADACRVVVHFPEAFPTWDLRKAARIVQEHDPTAYTALTGEQATGRAALRDRFVVVSATTCGNLVRCHARRHSDGSETRVLIPADKYRRLAQHCFDEFGSGYIVGDLDFEFSRQLTAAYYSGEGKR